MTYINICRQNMIRSAGILFEKNIIVQNNVKTTDNTLDIYMNIYYNIKKYCERGYGNVQKGNGVSEKLEGQQIP